MTPVSTYREAEAQLVSDGYAKAEVRAIFEDDILVREASIDWLLARLPFSWRDIARTRVRNGISREELRRALIEEYFAYQDRKREHRGLSFWKLVAAIVVGNLGTAVIVAIMWFGAR